MSGRRKYRNNYSNYNSSSAAYAYQVDASSAQPILDDPILTEQEYIRETKKIEIKRARAVEAAIDKRERLVHRLKLSIAMLGVFSGCFVTMASYASVARQRIENAKLNDELIGIQNENVSLQAEISDKVDLAYIESEAVNRLGMAEPQPYQIVYIDVPKQSYTVQYGAVESEEENKFSIASITKLFKS